MYTKTVVGQLISVCKKSFHSFNTDKKHPNRLLENLVDFYCTQLYYMVKFYSNTLKVQWKPFNKNLTSTYHKTFDLGKIIFFSVSLLFVPHPKLKKLLIFFLFCQFLTSDPSPPIFHCEVCRSSNLLCILATSDKIDAEGEPGKYMYMHATDYHLQNQDVNYKPNFVCARIFYKVQKSLVVANISCWRSALWCLGLNLSTGLHGSENKFLQTGINCCSQ